MLLHTFLYTRFQHTLAFVTEIAINNKYWKMCSCHMFWFGRTIFKQCTHDITKSILPTRQPLLLGIK
jgi:hypothetical protein